MKWTSANSKSVFYTSEETNGIYKEQPQQQHLQPQKSKGGGGGGVAESASLFTFRMGGGNDDDTTESANSKSSSASNSIERHGSGGTDLKRYLKNFMLFSNLEIESEKRCRDEQLTRVVKALMVFEKRLRREQEIIQQQLCEKDRVINRQLHTISRLGGGREELTEEVATSETAEFCPMCRKKYYLRAAKSTATQTSLKGFANSISDDYSSIQSVEYMSSSEEQEALQSPNPFSTARRSKKYTSKKSYKEYLQSRPHHTNGAPTPKDFLASDRNNNTIEPTTIASGKSAGAAKFSLIMNDIHGIRRQQKQQSCDDTHSLKINRMHGISLTTLNATANETTTAKEKDHSNSSGDDASDNQADGECVATRKKYCDEGLNVKQKIATRDDWYISDIEESETSLGGAKSPYGNVGSGVSNSVLECVNQILLQQSMDEYIEAKGEPAKETPKEPTTTRSNRRVHFSTKNSMVQIKPRHRQHSPPSSLLDHDVLNSTYENQSTYGNEYELIGSSSRTYVDMDTSSQRGESFKPKLPPKPDNLMKLQQIAKQRAFVHEQIYSKRSGSESEPDYASIAEIQESVTIVTAEIHHSSADDDGDDGDDDDGGENGSGNEYSEIKELSTETESSPPSPPEKEDDSFADVPKLPNVYSIIPGIEPLTPTSPTAKKESPNGKCIGHDNYITKSPMKKKPPLTFSATAVKKEKEETAELNAANKKPPAPLKHQQTIKIIDEKIQQEFDWYNLDAEYTKTDIVITPQNIENIEEMYQFDDEAAKVEYNLEDFEYETVPSSSSEGSANGIEIETSNGSFTTVIKINESHSVSSSASSSTSEAPASPVSKSAAASTTANLMELAETPKIDFKKSNKILYEKFLKESGLISKPILSSKKKFYAGSFV